MAIVRGITTTLSVDVEGDRFRNALGEDRNVYVTLQQNENLVTKYREDLEVTDITEEYEEQKDGETVTGTKTTGANIKVTLSKEDTEKFEVGGVQFQIRWNDNDGNTCGSKIVQIPIGGSLNEEKEK